MFGDVKDNVKVPLVEFRWLILLGPQNGLYKASKYYRKDLLGTPIVRVDSFYNGKVTVGNI